jgi:hypothetical protein
MGEGMGKASTGMDFQEHLGEIHSWESGEDVVAEREQAGGLLQFIEPGDSQCVMTVLLVYPDCSIRRQVGGGALIGQVELVREGLQFQLGGFAPAQGPADLGPHGVPLGALQQLHAGVAPAFTARDEDIPAAQALLEPVYETQRIRPPIYAGGVPWQDETSPRP